MSTADFCRACRAYAERFIGAMTEQFQRLGILGTWDAAVPDHGLQVPGGDCARVRSIRRAATGLQRQETGSLVHSLPHRTRGSRGRVRGPHIAFDLRRVPVASDARARFSRNASPSWLGATSRSSSGRRRPGRFRRTWPSRSIPSSITPPTTWTDARSSLPKRWRRRSVRLSAAPSIARSPDSKACNWRASAFATRSTSATRRECSENTSRFDAGTGAVHTALAMAPTISTPE